MKHLEQAVCYMALKLLNPTEYTYFSKEFMVCENVPKEPIASFIPETPSKPQEKLLAKQSILRLMRKCEMKGDAVIMPSDVYEQVFRLLRQV